MVSELDKAITETMPRLGTHYPRWAPPLATLFLTIFSVFTQLFPITATGTLATFPADDPTILLALCQSTRIWWSLPQTKLHAPFPWHVQQGQSTGSCKVLFGRDFDDKVYYPTWPCPSSFISIRHALGENPFLHHVSFYFVLFSGTVWIAILGIVHYIYECFALLQRTFRLPLSFFPACFSVLLFVGCAF